MTSRKVPDSAAIERIEDMVRLGGFVFSAEDSVVVSTVLDATDAGRTAAFYVSRRQYRAVMKDYWTKERVDVVGLQPVSGDEIERIKTDLDLEISGYSNEFDCPRCGHRYGSYEFLEQGLEEHGAQMTRAVFGLRDAGIIRVNPTESPVCRNCRLAMIALQHHYGYQGYGCCVEL